MRPEAHDTAKDDSATEPHGYKGVLFSLDGRVVFGYNGMTKEDVIAQLEKAHKRDWPLHPIVAIIKDDGRPAKMKQRILSSPNLPQSLIGKSIQTVCTALKQAEEILSAMH